MVLKLIKIDIAALCYAETAEIVTWYNEALLRCDENILDVGMTVIVRGLNLKAISVSRCEFHKINSDVNWIRFLIWLHPSSTPASVDVVDKQ